VALDREVAARDRAPEGRRRPRRDPPEQGVRRADLLDPARRLQRQRGVVVRVGGEPALGERLEGGVEDEGRHGGTMPETVAAKTVTRVHG